MKHIRIIIIFVSVLLMFSLVTSAAWAATPIQGEGPGTPIEQVGQVSTGLAPQSPVITGGIQSLSGSNVTFAPSAGGDTCFAPGVTQTLCFQSDSYTNDYEYVYNNWLKFPEDWVVSNVYVQGTPTCTTGSWGTFSWSFQTSPYEVNINHTRYQSTTDHCVATYCVEVTPASAPSAPVSWYFDGDGYGNVPHNPCSDDGYTPASQNACDEAVNPAAQVPTCEPHISLTPEDQSGQGCKGVEQTYTLTLKNFSGAGGTFAISYNQDFIGHVSGPVSISLANNASTSFEVSILPHSCLEEGDIHLTVSATNGAYSDSASITQNVYAGQQGWHQIATNPVIAMDNVLAAYDGKVWSITGYGSTGVSNYDPATDAWASVAGSAPGFANYARSGCQIGSKVYIYGDTNGGYTGLWSYDMASNVWLQETPTGTAPAQNAIWAPSWVADEDNGLCYMTGGATAPGNGNLASVYVYDAINNQWLTPLPDFSTMRDFHAAFFFNRPADGHDLLCVAGGINTSAALDSTQCYDFSSAAWNAENADLGATPLPTWGMGYTLRPTAAGDQLWLVNGVGPDGMLHGQNWYYDVAGGTWYDAGPLPSGMVYRTAAITLNGEVYHVGGSPGSFSPSGLADVFMERTCPACSLAFSKQAPAEALPGDTLTYTIQLFPYTLFPASLVDPLPAGVEYVPGSLTVDPDVGAYNYDDASNSILWDFMPFKQRNLNQWKPVAVNTEKSGPAPLTLKGPDAKAQSVPQVAISSTVLWDQPLSAVNQNTYVDQDFSDLPTYSSFLSDDFVADEPWAIGSIFVPGNGWNGFSSLENASALNFLIFEDGGGVPAGDPSGGGDAPLWALSLPVSDPQVALSVGSGSYVSNVTLTLDDPVILPAGHYWLAYYPSMAYSSYGQFGLQPADTSNGNTTQLINPGGGFGLGTAWQNWNVLGSELTQTDMAFRLESADILTITYDVHITGDGFTIDNTAYLDVNGYDLEANALTQVPILHRVYLPILQR